MKSVVVSGNIDRDHLMSIPDLIKDSILPGQLNNLSVSFQPNTHIVDFGGAAANIAYTLKMLGINPLLFSVLGSDYKRFFERFAKLGISTEFIDINENGLSPSCYILTDRENNQITFFSSGVMLNHDFCMNLKGLSGEHVDLMILSPNTTERTLALAREAVKKGIKYIFDPGQSITNYDKGAIEELIYNSIGVIVNSYELNLLMKKTGSSVEDILDNVDFLIRTRGLEGSEIFQKNKPPESVPAILVVNSDPTGCGDAFRAGLIYSYLNGDSLVRACEIGTVAASFKLECKGTQNHIFTLEQFQERLNEHFPVRN